MIQQPTQWRPPYPPPYQTHPQPPQPARVVPNIKGAKFVADGLLWTGWCAIALSVAVAGFILLGALLSGSAEGLVMFFVASVLPVLGGILTGLLLLAAGYGLHMLIVIAARP